LESLAEPGGICISGTVYDHVENKLALGYEYLGEQAVKNIAKPVRVYRVVLDEAAWALAEHARERQTPQRAARRRGLPWELVSAAIVILAVGGVAVVWYQPLAFLQRSARITQEEPALPLPAKPSP
jgi:adenylate cyclase